MLFNVHVKPSGKKLMKIELCLLFMIFESIDLRNNIFDATSTEKLK